MAASPGAEEAAWIWVNQASRLLEFTVVLEEGRFVQAGWPELLEGKRVEVAWVTDAEVGSVDARRFELGERVMGEGGVGIVPVFRLESKWRGSLNYAAKWQAEVAGGRR